MYVVFVYKGTKSLRYIRNNPSVCFGINVGERAGEIKCVLLRGKGKIVDDIDVMKKIYLKILTKYLPSKQEAEAFLQKLTITGIVAKRTLVVIKPVKILAWKL